MPFYTSDKYQVPIPRNCPHCKKSVSWDFNYCPHCGSSLLRKPTSSNLDDILKGVTLPKNEKWKKLGIDPDAIPLYEYCPRCGQRIVRPPKINPQNIYEIDKSKLTGGDSCFIVTACNADTETLDTFYNFRDNVLLDSPLGKEFVRFYYLFSPKIANIIRKSKTIQALILLVLLRPLSAILKATLLRFK